jgi:hypothetical protein
MPSEAPEESAPSSERVPRESLSRRLYGIDWSSHLPMEVSDGVQACESSFEASLPFVREHYAAIFEEDGASPFSTSRVGTQKERYYRLAGDFFEFKEGPRTIGLFVGTPVDWSTYYIRSAAMLPECAGGRVASGFLGRLLEILRGFGIERVEADASPSNFATMSILTRLSFNVTGTVLTDRWGAHVRFTRFLDPESEQIFLNQFCSGVRYQLRGKSTATR